MSSSSTGQTGLPPPLKPPYPAAAAMLGGTPTPNPDIPVSAVLLACFVAGAAVHVVIFHRNRARDHKFVYSMLLFGFCMTRLVALSLRIAWAAHNTDANLALAATVFTSAGVLLLFILNLILGLRIVKGLFPSFGWSRTMKWAFRGLVGSLVAVLVMVVVCSVHSMFTLDVDVRRRERDVMLFAGVYMAVLAFLPAVGMAVAVVVPWRDTVEKFGKGRMETKMAMLAFTSVLLTLGAGFRVGVNFAAKPAGQEQWYHSRAAFYCFNFAIELVVVYTYAIFRFDQRFHIPDGSSAPGHFSGGGPGQQNGSNGWANGYGDTASGEPDKVRV